MSDPTKRRGDDWWRHLLLWVAVAIAVFPPLYVITAAFKKLFSTHLDLD